MKKIIITFSILSLGIACAAEDANRLPVSDDALSSALIPQDKIPHYHGIPDAKNIYKVESQKAIESIKMLINIWKERSEQLTETSFWRFLEGLGKKRQAIANKCGSQDSELFGQARCEKNIFTDLHPYAIMRDFAAGIPRENKNPMFKFSLDEQKIMRKNLQGITKKAVTNEEKILINRKYYTLSELRLIDEQLQYQQQNFPENSGLFIYSTPLSGEEALSRRFCLSITHASDGNSYMNAILQTHGSAAHNSAAILELYNLFETFIKASSPGAVFAFFHKFAITMPFCRGSCAINEWFLDAMLQAIKFPMPKQSVFAEFDQMAQISTREDFVQFMMTKIPLQQ